MKESKPPAKRRATAEDVVIGQKLRALRLDRGLTGALRLVRAYAVIPERGPRAALVTLAESLAHGRQA